MEGKLEKGKEVLKVTGQARNLNCIWDRRKWFICMKCPVLQTISNTCKPQTWTRFLHTHFLFKKWLVWGEFDHTLGSYSLHTSFFKKTKTMLSIHFHYWCNIRTSDGLAPATLIQIIFSPTIRIQRGKKYFVFLVLYTCNCVCLNFNEFIMCFDSWPLSWTANACLQRIHSLTRGWTSWYSGWPLFVQFMGWGYKFHPLDDKLGL